MDDGRYTRRAILRRSAGLIGVFAASGILAACGNGATSPTATSAPTGTNAPATVGASGGATRPPTGSAVTGAGVGGAQPTAAASSAVAATGTLQNPATFAPPKVKASSPTTLSMWHWAGFHQTVQKAIIAEYNKRFDPNVSVEITAYPSLDLQRAAVKAAFAGGSSTPDILSVEPGDYGVDLGTSKSVLGFGQVFKDDPEYFQGLWPNALSILTVNGDTIAVPVATNTVVVYYNKKMFAQNNVQVPETLDDLKKLSPVFNGKGIAPIVATTAQDLNHAAWPFFSAVGGLQVDKLMRDADLGKAAWTSPELVEAAGIAESVMRSDLIIKGQLGIKETDAIAVFSTGKAAMLWGGQWLRTSIGQAIPPDFDLGIFPFPAVKAGGPKPVLSSNGLSFAVNAKSKNAPLAFEIIKAMTGAWGKIEYSKALALSPNGPITADALAYQQQSLKDPLYPEFLKLQPTGTSRIVFTLQVSQALFQGMQAMIAGQKSSKQVLDDVEAVSKQVGTRTFTIG